MDQTPENLLEQLREAVDLGHKARNDSFLRQVSLACSSQGTPLPQAAGKSEGNTASGLMSLYRLLDNDQATLSDLRAARSQVVMRRLPTDGDVLIVHDVSVFDFSRHNSKKDRRPVGDHRGKGYEYVPCIAVDPKTSSILGVLHDTLINEEGPDDRDVMNYDYEPLFMAFSPEERKRLQKNHRHQMAVHINGLAPLLKGSHAIHVADREFDDIYILGSCDRNDSDYVIRSCANRNVQVLDNDELPDEVRTGKQTGHPVSPGWTCVSLERWSRSLPMRPYKSLPLDSRGRVTEMRSAARIANLSIGAGRIRLYRSALRNGKYFRHPNYVDVNFVAIRELNPPEGAKSLYWAIFTSLPIETEGQQNYVGHVYELRWRAEDFFRLLKSGYGIDESRLDNATKLARLLVILTLAAMTIVNMKAKFGLPTKGLMDEKDYRRVIQAVREPRNLELDLELRLFGLILKWGGWIGRRRDPIGPTVLMRGILQLMAVLNALDEHSDLIAEARKHREALRRFFG